MNYLKTKLAKFILFIHVNYINDINDYPLNMFGRYLITPLYILNKIFIYIFSFMLFPIVLIHMNYKYKILKMLLSINKNL